MNGGYKLGNDEPRLPRGFSEIFGIDAENFAYLISSWVQITTLHGYAAMFLSPVTHAKIYESHNAAIERNYSFQDKSSRLLTLICDSLPYLSNLYSSQNNEHVRWSYVCDVFRYVRKSRRHWHFLGILEISPQPAYVQSVSQLMLTAHQFLCNRVDFHFLTNDHGFWKISLKKRAQEHYQELLRQLAKSGTNATKAVEMIGSFYSASELAVIQHIGLLRRGGLSSVDTNVLKNQLLSIEPDLEFEIDGWIDFIESLDLAVRGATRLDFLNFHAIEFHDGPMFEIYDTSESIRFGDGGSYSSYISNECAKTVKAHGMVVVPERLLTHLSSIEKKSSLIVATCKSSFQAAQKIAIEIRSQKRIAEVIYGPGLTDTAIRQYSKLRKFSRRYTISSETIGKGMVEVFTEGSGWAVIPFPFQSVSEM